MQLKSILLISCGFLFGNILVSSDHPLSQLYAIEAECPEDEAEGPEFIDENDNYDDEHDWRFEEDEEEFNQEASWPSKREDPWMEDLMR